MTPIRGFTLIELMIVVAIVGVLAAMAIPSYQDYVAKSQAARVMAETGGLRAAVEICVNESRVILGTAVNQCEPGAVGSVLISGASQTGALLPAGSGVPQVVMPVSGIVTIESTFSATAIPLFFGNTLTWSRDINGAWSCATTIDPQYRPRGCE